MLLLNVHGYGPRSQLVRDAVSHFLQGCSLSVSVINGIEYQGISAELYYFRDTKHADIITYNEASDAALVKHLAHECVHVHQCINGQLVHSSEGSYFMGRYYRKGEIDYMDQPWEVEAFAKEQPWAEMFFCLHPHYQRCFP